MKHLNLLCFVLLFSIGATAQDAGTISLNLYGGYTFSDKVEYKLAYGEVGEGFQYGAGFEYHIDEENSVELKYLRLDTNMPLYFNGEYLNEGDDKGAFNYILVEGTHYFDVSPKAKPYLGGGLGLAIVETPQSGNETEFAWDIKAGVKIKTASSVSINLYGYLESVSAAAGNSYYYTYYGVVGVTDYVAVFQFGLGVALSYNFKS
jgi:opacity protein-like surface antigen